MQTQSSGLLLSSKYQPKPNAYPSPTSKENDLSQSVLVENPTDHHNRYLTQPNAAHQAHLVTRRGNGHPRSTYSFHPGDPPNDNSPYHQPFREAGLHSTDNAGVGILQAGPPSSASMEIRRANVDVDPHGSNAEAETNVPSQ